MFLSYETEDYASFITLFRKLLRHCRLGKIVIMFCASEGLNGEISWCPDCQKTIPVVFNVIRNLPATGCFVYAKVGDRTTWKNPNNPFRLDPVLKLEKTPTLIRFWVDPNDVREEIRLEEDECLDTYLLGKIFS